MSASKQDIKDLGFIINEAVRLSKLLSQNIELYKAEFDSDIDIITSKLQPPKELEADITIQFIVSPKARIRLEEIAKRHKRLVHGVTLGEVIQEIENSLYIHIKNKGNLDDKGYQKLLSRAHKRLERIKEETVYYFPFNAVGLDCNSQIKIGKVSIIAKSNIYSKVEEDAYYELFMQSKEASYDFVLSIPIDNASQNFSKIQAQNVANYIYGVIKVFATSYNYDAKKISLLNHPIVDDINHYVVSHSNEFWIGGSYTFGEDLSDFWQKFQSDMNTDIGRILGELTNYALTVNSKDCLADRLIDAFYWFGDALRDSNKNGQIVKLVIALERLVTIEGEKNNDIALNFRKRVSSMVAIFSKEQQEYERQAKEIYKLRSSLVHGTRGLTKNSNFNLNFSPVQLVYKTILSACIVFSKLGLELTTYKKPLIKEFDALIKYHENK